MAITLALGLLPVIFIATAVTKDLLNVYHPHRDSSLNSKPNAMGRLARAQLEIMRELGKHRSDTANELTDRVMEMLEKLDEQTRFQYQCWVEELRAREDLSLKRIQLARVRMSSAAQHFLDYVLQIQQNERMSQEEKFTRLEELGKAMDHGIRQEIAQHLLANGNSTIPKALSQPNV